MLHKDVTAEQRKRTRRPGEIGVRFGEVASLHIAAVKQSNGNWATAASVDTNDHLKRLIEIGDRNIAECPKCEG